MASGRITIDQERCKGCELCRWACPPDIITLASDLNSMGYRPATLLDPENQCTGCALCAMVCPDAVIKVYRTMPAAHARRALAEVA